MNIIEKANMRLIENQMKKAKNYDEQATNQSSPQRAIDNSKMNIYQKSAIILGILIFIAGFVVSQNNVCSGYPEVCEETTNMSILLGVWTGGYLSCLLIYGIGEIVQQLKIANQNK